MSKVIQDALDIIDIPSTGQGSKTVRLTPSQIGRVIRFRLTAKFTLPAAPAVHQDGLGRFLKFELMNGSDTYYTVEGNVLLQANQNILHADQDYTEVPAVVGDQTGTWNGEIWIADPALQYPDMLAMDHRLLTDPRLRITFNGPASVCPTAGATMKAGDPGTIEFENELLEVEGDLPQKMLNPWRRWHTYQIDDLKASTADQKRVLEFGLFTSRLLIIQETATGTIARSNSLINAVELRVNGIPRGKQSWTSMQAALRGIGGVNYPPKTGVGLFDFDPHKTLDKGTMLDLRGAKLFQLLFSTGAFAAGNKTWILHEEIVEPDYAAIAAELAKRQRK